MELKRLRALAAIAQHQGIGRAARELGIAQPALSRQVRALEIDVGTPLLERSPSGVRLTAAGGALMARVAGLDERLAAAITSARLASAGRRGRVRLALGRLAIDDPRLSAALTAFERAEPAVQLEVLEIGTPLHTRALLHGEADLAIGVEESPQNTRLERRTLRIERIDRALIPSTHALATRREVTPADLAGLPLLMAGRAHGWIFPTVRRAVQDLGIAIGGECEMLETAYARVAAGQAWVATAAGQATRPPTGTVAIPLHGLDVELPVQLRWRKGASSALVLRVARALVRAFRHDVAGGPRAATPAVAAAPEAAATRLVEAVEARHLRAFVTVTDEGTLGDAARRLDLTKSAVSRQVGALERIVGAALLERRAGLLVMTVAGEALRDEAVAALRALQGATTAAQLAARGVARECIVAIVPTPLAENRLRSLLERLPRALPQVALEVRELGGARALEALARGEVDVAYVVQPDSLPVADRFRSRRVEADAIDTVLVSSSGPLGERAALVPSDVAALPFLFFGRGSDPRYREHLMAELRGSGIDPRPAPPFDGARAIRRVVADGGGWTIAARSMRLAPPAGIVALPMLGFSIDASLRLVWRRDEPDPHVLSLIALA